MFLPVNLGLCMTRNSSSVSPLDTKFFEKANVSHLELNLGVLRRMMKLRLQRQSFVPSTREGCNDKILQRYVHMPLFVRDLSKHMQMICMSRYNQTIGKTLVLSNVSRLPSLQIQVLSYPPGGLLWRGGGFRDVHRPFFEKNLHNKIRVSDVSLKNCIFRLRICV